MNRKLNESLAFSAAADWVPMAQYRQVIGVGVVDDGSVTVQLRKATDDEGSEADDLGNSVQADLQAVAHANASALGETEDGTPFTHVSAVITGPGSPAAESAGMVIRGDGRFSE